MILSLKCSWKSQINESRHYTLAQSVISMHRMCNILQGDRKSSNCLSVEKFQSESNTLSEILSILTTKTLIGVFLQCPLYQHMAIPRLYFQMLFSNKLECFLLHTYRYISIFLQYYRCRTRIYLLGCISSTVRNEAFEGKAAPFSYFIRWKGLPPRYCIKISPNFSVLPPSYRACDFT